jgi:hypothetical protein
MPPHPVVEHLLAWVRERITTTASDPPQLDAELRADFGAMPT